MPIAVQFVPAKRNSLRNGTLCRAFRRACRLICKYSFDVSVRCNRKAGASVCIHVGSCAAFFQFLNALRRDSPSIALVCCPCSGECIRKRGIVRRAVVQLHVDNTAFGKNPL